MMGPESIASDLVVPFRPPTPPRERLAPTASIPPNPRILTDLKNPPQAAGACSAFEGVKPSNTPTSRSPASPGNSRASKRVEFSGQAQYFNNDDAAQRQSTPRSASSLLPHPAKSILKRSIIPTEHLSSLGSINGSAASGVTMAEMLESTLLQLSNGDTQSKIDAYRTLADGFRASSNLPDRILMQEKTPEFLKYIRSHLENSNVAETTECQLVVSCLKFFVSCLMIPTIAKLIASDFAIFYLDFCASVLAGKEPLRPSYPKEAVRWLMQGMAMGILNFQPRVLTSERVGRLVSVLFHAERKLPGKAILYTRMAIYQALLRVALPAMIAHPAWIENIFEDMLSQVKDVRQAAIDLGLEVGYANVRNSQISKIVKTLMESKYENQSYEEYYSRYLVNMVETKSEGITSVPQIWSVVLVLLAVPFNKWKRFNQWLQIIQKCFNSGNLTCRREANLAWARLVYVSHTMPGSFTNQLATFVLPIKSQISRKPGSPAVEELRQVVYGTANMILYYSFNPSLSESQVEQHWKSATAVIVQALVNNWKVPGSVDQATRILTSLLESRQRLWEDNLIAKFTTATPEQLPPLGPVWIRQHSATVFALLGPLFKQEFASMGLVDSRLFKLWMTLLTTVKSVVASEIKTSTDTAVFLASVLTLLLEIWEAGLPGLGHEASPVSPSQFLAGMSAFLTALISTLGNPAFTEKMLTLDKSKTKFTHEPAIAGHSSKKALATTPRQHLLSMLTQPPPGILDDDAYAEFLNATFAPFFECKNSTSKRALAQELLQLVPSSDACTYGAWSVAIGFMLGDMQSTQGTNDSSGSDLPLGNEYRELVKLLARGLQHCPNMPAGAWERAADSIAAQLTEQAGEAGRAIALVEPLAKSIMPPQKQLASSLPPAALFRAAARLVAASTQPRDQHALDAAHRRLWGTSIGLRPSRTLDPFEHMYSLTSCLMVFAYVGLDNYDSDDVVHPLLSQVTMYLHRCRDTAPRRALLGLQEGLATWARDEQGRVSSRADSKLARVVKDLCENICHLLTMYSPADLPIQQLEPLLIAGFESKHRHVVNSMVLSWNRIFEQANDLRWPEKLKETLLALRNQSGVDIALPGLQPSSFVSSNGQGHSFIETQDDLGALEPSAEAHLLSAISPARGTSHSPMVRFPPSSNKSTSNNNPVISKPTLRWPHVEAAAPPKRHEDSQIQFEAIPSSPISERVLESQLLTDRQKEIRDRQRETSALYSDRRQNDTQAPDLPQPPKQFRAAQRLSTPEPNRVGGREFIPSTPTPRRGEGVKAIELAENDPPSSPPDPRRFPLVRGDTTPRPQSGSLVQEWPLSSSPASDGPNVPQPESPILGADPVLAAMDDIPEELLRTIDLDASAESAMPPHDSSVQGTGSISVGIPQDSQTFAGPELSQPHESTELADVTMTADDDVNQVTPTPSRWNATDSIGPGNNQQQISASAPQLSPSPIPQPNPVVAHRGHVFVDADVPTQPVNEVSSQRESQEEASAASLDTVSQSQKKHHSPTPLPAQVPANNNTELVSKSATSFSMSDLSEAALARLAAQAESATQEIVALSASKNRSDSQSQSQLTQAEESHPFARTSKASSVAPTSTIEIVIPATPSQSMVVTEMSASRKRKRDSATIPANVITVDGDNDSISRRLRLRASGPPGSPTTAGVPSVAQPTAPADPPVPPDHNVANANTQPVKRKRGRPRKHPLPVEPAGGTVVTPAPSKRRKISTNKRNSGGSETGTVQATPSNSLNDTSALKSPDAKRTPLPYERLRSRRRKFTVETQSQKEDETPAVTGPETELETLELGQHMSVSVESIQPLQPQQAIVEASPPQDKQDVQILAEQHAEPSVEQEIKALTEPQAAQQLEKPVEELVEESVEEPVEHLADVERQTEEEVEQEAENGAEQHAEEHLENKREVGDDKQVQRTVERQVDSQMEQQLPQHAQEEDTTMGEPSTFFDAREHLTVDTQLNHAIGHNMLMPTASQGHDHVATSRSNEENVADMASGLDIDVGTSAIPTTVSGPCGVSTSDTTMQPMLAESNQWPVNPTAEQQVEAEATPAVETLHVQTTSPVEVDSSVLAPTSAQVPISLREASPVQRILNALTDAKQLLTTLDLGRQNVFEIENAVMELKRELFEAEMRGRNPGFN